MGGAGAGSRSLVGAPLGVDSAPGDDGGARLCGSAFRTLDTRQRKRSLVVFFTDVIDRRASQSLIAHTTVARAITCRCWWRCATRPWWPRRRARMRRRRARCTSVPAAEELLSAREEALERMRQAGVSVIDVRPQAMTAAVINRYVETQGPRRGVGGIGVSASKTPRKRSQGPLRSSPKQTRALRPSACGSPTLCPARRARRDRTPRTCQRLRTCRCPTQVPGYVAS